MPEDGPRYDETARTFLGEIAGARIVDVTQHDRDEFLETGDPYVALLLDSGAVLTFFRNGDVRLERPDGRVTTIGPPDEEDDDKEERHV